MIKRYPTNCGDATCASCVKAGDFIFLAHHAGGFDKSDVTHQARTTFERMSVSLNQAGANLKDIVQINLYLKDLKDFSKARDVFYEVFGAEPPARMSLTTNFIEEKCLLMMDAIAYKNEQ